MRLFYGAANWAVKYPLYPIRIFGISFARLIISSKKGVVMKSLILHPTEVSQWQALVNEAEAHAQLILSENMESYLVFLLIRFSRGTQWVESLIGLDFLNTVKSHGTQQVEHLKDVGDKSLLFSGLFPELAQKRNVSLRYFSEMGQFAYYTAGCFQEHEMAELFNQLGHQFDILQRVLQALRPHTKEAHLFDSLYHLR